MAPNSRLIQDYLFEHCTVKAAHMHNAWALFRKSFAMGLQKIRSFIEELLIKRLTKFKPTKP